MQKSLASSRHLPASPAQARISSAIVPSGGDPLAGTIVQIFAHGFDAQPEQGTLFYVGGFDKPLSCIGLQIPDRELERLLGSAHIGDAVLIASRDLFLTRGGHAVLHLVWGEPERVLLSFAQTLAPDQIARIARSIQEASPQLAIGLAADQDLAHALKGLQAGGTAQEEAIFWLLGRGLGLTPSGDDILSGFGAGLLAAQEKEAFASFSCTLRSVLSRRSTTAVSTAYLTAMLSGSMNEGMLCFLEAAAAGEDLVAPLARARSYGHTSGDDMLLGLYTAFA